VDPYIEPYPRTPSIWQQFAVVPRHPARAGRNDILGQTFPPETWDDFDLWIALEGRSVVELMGVSRPFDGGSCLLVPPLVSIVQGIPTGSLFRIAYFHFDIAYKGEILRDARQYVQEAPDGTMVLALPDTPPLALFAPLDTVQLADRLLRAVRKWDDISQLQSVSLVINALAEHRREAVRASGGGGRGVSAVDAALQYLEDNLHEPIFVADMAGHVRLSPTHLTRLFRAQLQETPMQALTRMRLSRAQNLLRDPALNISEISSMCGFDSLSFFTRVFARQFGCPPTAFRRRMQRPIKQRRDAKSEEE
jgi:AraC-like DNA-binding protein